MVKFIQFLPSTKSWVLNSIWQFNHCFGEDYYLGDSIFQKEVIHYLAKGNRQCVHYQTLETGFDLVLNNSTVRFRCCSQLWSPSSQDSVNHRPPLNCPLLRLGRKFHQAFLRCRFFFTPIVYDINYTDSLKTYSIVLIDIGDVMYQSITTPIQILPITYRFCIYIYKGCAKSL